MDGQITDRIDARLTEREREVVRRIAEGDTTDQVAARLFISRTTVDTHVRRLREKLGKAGDVIETVRGFGYRLREE